MNDTQDYPIGTQHWYFTDGKCTDPDEPWRKMNLHLAVQQPGHFCCDDGQCIVFSTIDPDSQRSCYGHISVNCHQNEVKNTGFGTEQADGIHCIKAVVRIWPDVA